MKRILTNWAIKITRSKCAQLGRSYDKMQKLRCLNMNPSHSHFVSICKKAYAKHLLVSYEICPVRQSLARPSADSSNMASSGLLTAFPRDSSTPPRLQPPLEPHQPPFRQHRRTASSPPHLSSCIATTPRQLHHSSPRSLQCVSPPSIASAPPPASSPCNLRSTISACAATIAPPSSSTSAPSPCHAFFNVRSSCSSCLLPSSTQLVRVPRAERHLPRACLVLASRLPRACLVRRLARRFTVVLFAHPRRSMSIVMYPPARLSILSCCMRYTIVACCGILKLLMSWVIRCSIYTM